MTNNHPAHGPVSLDRLHQISEILSKAAAQSDGGNLGYAMADAVKVIDGVIAAFGAEPVGEVVLGEYDDCGSYPDARVVCIAADGQADWENFKDGTRLYAVNPAQVSIDERAAFNAWNNDENLPIAGVGAKNAAWLAWQARATMLQSFGNSEQLKPLSHGVKLPLDYLQGHKDGLEWAAQLAEANHPQTGDWLYDDPIELAGAIRKGPDMPPVQTASVVDADDNFYSWFGREWEKYYQPNNYSLSAKKHLGAIAESAWFACRAAMLQAGNSPVTPDGWVMVPKEMTPEMMRHVQIGSELGAYAAANLSGAYGLFAEFWDVACRAAGNSPVSPDGWIPVSHRMPNDKDFVWCWGYVSGWTESDGFEAYYDATRNKWWTIDDETVRKVTHWMPLPAAPQQEVIGIDLASGKDVSAEVVIENGKVI